MHPIEIAAHAGIVVLCLGVMAVACAAFLIWRGRK